MIVLLICILAEEERERARATEVQVIYGLASVCQNLVIHVNPTRSEA